MDIIVDVTELAAIDEMVTYGKEGGGKCACNNAM